MFMHINNSVVFGALISVAGALVKLH